MAGLPSGLLDVWRLQQGPEQQAKDEQLKGWTASSLAEAHMRYQLDKHDAAVNEPRQGCTNADPPSLSSIAVGRVLEVLGESSDLAADVRTIAESLGSTILKQLLDDQRTPYLVLRCFCSTPQCSVAQGRLPVDIDEAVLRNERYVRSLGDSSRKRRHVIALEDLCGTLSGPTENNGVLTLTRKDPPKGGFEVLDELRKRRLSVLSNSAIFSQTFSRITQGILNGLDWSNVLVAGGMALTTLLHTDPSKDNEREVVDPDIDLYIYGLGPDDANRKVREIHDTWVSNLPATAGQRLVVKNAKTINLLTSYPNRRIQIILKLLPSPTDVLLNFDLDACAIGFDGGRVCMLPRCARALETGYSVFTMDLIWGHHLGDRRASQDSRVFKYAERGFGIRFLPSSVRSLEEDNLESVVFRYDSPRPATDAADYAASKGDDVRTNRQNHRKPYGTEPGLKTLKRIAYLAQDYVHRFYFGATPLALSPAQYQKQRKNLGLPYDDNIINNERAETAWLKEYRLAESDIASHKEVNEKCKALDQPLVSGPIISLASLDKRNMHNDLPDGRRGLGLFEMFMRHCEAWRLHALGEAKYEESLRELKAHATFQLMRRMADLTMALSVRRPVWPTTQKLMTISLHMYGISTSTLHTSFKR